jgi:hypothetical protein
MGNSELSATTSLYGTACCGRLLFIIYVTVSLLFLRIL